ncbi:siderophore-interacting protein [Mobilicoccus massiliensis]|uniref:siderophore-interacting protein n=1 Tax=Mobilicoccus massiliensis TaxID=1522310 RepID=UPI001596C87F|nr:siderophore-interacting protein [Mobilicoccus massiliensis]
MPRPGEPGTEAHSTSPTARPVRPAGAARAGARGAAGPLRRSGAPRVCVVTEVIDLTPRLRRVRFRSDDLIGVEPVSPAQRATIVLPAGGSFGPEGLDSAEYSAARRTRRTYTLCDLDPRTGTAAIDLVRHGTGVAGTWVERVRPGDDFVLSGPMGKFHLDPAQTHYVLIADETAVPALREICAQLPAGARAEVHVEVADEAERIDLPSPAELDVTWWLRSEHGGEVGELVGRLAPHLRTAGPGVTVWIGAEADSVTALRTHLLAEAGCDRRLLDAVAYWRRGRAES